MVSILTLYGLSKNSYRNRVLNKLMEIDYSEEFVRQRIVKYTSYSESLIPGCFMQGSFVIICKIIWLFISFLLLVMQMIVIIAISQKHLLLILLPYLV